MSEEWNISFRIGGKRLSHALSLIHSLRPNALSVQPIAEREARGPSGDQVLALFKPGKRLSVAEVATVLGSNMKLTGQRLAYLGAKKALKRVGSGVYVRAGK